MGGKCDGTNCWYHIVKIGAFELHAVYQNNSAICGGQNSTDCLYGKFVAFISEGSIDPSQFGKGGTRAVQLIK